MPYLCYGLEESLFVQLMSNTYRTVENLDNSISSQACTFLSAVATEVSAKKRFYSVESVDVLRCFIPLVMYRILGSDVYVETQWSFTRPLFSLVLCQLEWFEAYLSDLIQRQAPEIQEPLQNVF